MPTMTLAIPPELKQKMDQYPEYNWSAVARKAFEQRIADVEFLEKFSRDSTATEEDAIRWGKDLKKRIAQRWRDEAGG